METAVKQAMVKCGRREGLCGQYLTAFCCTECWLNDVRVTPYIWNLWIFKARLWWQFVRNF